MGLVPRLLTGANLLFRYPIMGFFVGLSLREDFCLEDRKRIEKGGDILFCGRRPRVRHVVRFTSPHPPSALGKPHWLPPFRFRSARRVVTGASNGNGRRGRQGMRRGDPRRRCRGQERPRAGAGRDGPRWGLHGRRARQAPPRPPRPRRRQEPAATTTPLPSPSPAQAAFILPCHREKGESFAAKLGDQSEFVQVDIRDARMLEKALQGADLVVHAAGPFEREDKCTVLEAAISTKTAYIDVCVDMDYSWRAKSFHEQAKAAGIPAITTAGIYPGVSNVMAAELVHAARSENAGEPERLRFFYYTAGSGGAGPTIMATSILLLGVDVIAYNKGEEIKLKPYTGALNIDFGKGVGKKNVYLMNLPEVKSAFKILGVPTVSARFGTDPFFWNWGMQAFANFLPVEVLRDKRLIRKLVETVDPLIRAIDGIAGERASIRVDLECSNGRNTTGLFTHKKLSVSVGQATAAFVLAVLEGSTQPGVWFPEEPEGIAIEARKLLLERASQGTINFVMNKPS